MKLLKQCCTSAQSFKLKELGITQERLFANYTWERKDGPSYWFHYQPPLVYAEDAHRFATAFTVAELGVMLGRGITVHKPEPDRNEASDRANDLIHMLKIGELLVDSCNERLKNS